MNSKTSGTSAIYDPRDPVLRQDPYPTYARLLAESPVHHSPVVGATVVAGHDAIQSLLGDPRLSSSRVEAILARAEGDEASMGRLRDALAGWVLFQDPPDHRRLRGLIGKAFTPRMSERLRPTVRSLAGDLVSSMKASERADLIADLAYPLPVIVIAELLGARAVDRDLLKEWSDGLAAFLATPRPSADETRRAADSVQGFEEYFRVRIDERRAEPQEDLISELIRAEEDGHGLDERELLAICMVLVFAGHETTTNLIGNGMLALLRNPDALAWLREDLDRVPQAIEELLRYDAPVQFVTRVAQEDLEIEGLPVPGGSPLFLLLGAANRDPTVFHEPDRLVLERDPNRHLAFGHASHFCLGAPLARIEGAVAVQTLLDASPELALGEEPLEWRSDLAFRGVRRLPIHFRGS